MCVSHFKFGLMTFWEIITRAISDKNVRLKFNVKAGFIAQIRTLPIGINLEPLHESQNDQNKSFRLIKTHWPQHDRLIKIIHTFATGQWWSRPRLEWHGNIPTPSPTNIFHPYPVLIRLSLSPPYYLSFCPHSLPTCKTHPYTTCQPTVAI